MKDPSEPYYVTTFAPSEIKRQLGIRQSELRVMLAIISHETVFGSSPTRAAVAKFLGIQPNGYWLMRNGWITSRVVGPAVGNRIAIWKATQFAKSALGLGESSESKGAA